MTAPHETITSVEPTFITVPLRSISTASTVLPDRFVMTRRPARWSTARRSPGRVPARFRIFRHRSRVNRKGTNSRAANTHPPGSPGRMRPSGSVRWMEPCRLRLVDIRGHAGSMRIGASGTASEVDGGIDAVLSVHAIRRSLVVVPARAYRRRSATPAIRRRCARRPGSPRAAGGRARYPRTWCCRRRHRACTEDSSPRASSQCSVACTAAASSRRPGPSCRPPAADCPRSTTNTRAPCQDSARAIVPPPALSR